MGNRLIFLLFVSAFLFSCSNTEKKENSDKINVLSTTGMIYDIALNVGGEKVNAQYLMGPGVDPHLYKATQNDLSKMREAEIIFYNGLHLEGKMQETLEKISNSKPVIPVSSGIKKSLLKESEDFGGVYDPHIWFDVSLWKQAVIIVTNTLIKSDEENKEYYLNNSKDYLSALSALDAWVKESIATIPEQQRVMITAHDAFGYFGDAYNIEVRGLQGISTRSEPGIRDISRLTEYITENDIKAVFVESSVSEKSLRAVVEGCREKGHNVQIGGTLFSDAMGAAGTPEGTYEGMVRHNVNTIVNSLK
ncbi:zinc ABC transporter substrate-binding protein [Mangrovivirga sp. M17]|uniref:Zinc ABC transporter substrate-binding protein n=1 Tax=Mangrovivirga halotolerans TaxID=2993936 RepID=A0ABT3RRQ4_9BACT|nr:zinc ABC transporter substrate-binding protein [Mangrovivirga halotolerans]MCX2744252.1 zinc ABC transporter substrate-binding protein [Mangrovivirga halotolerans]